VVIQSVGRRAKRSGGESNRQSRHQSGRGGRGRGIHHQPPSRHDSGRRGEKEGAKSEGKESVSPGHQSPGPFGQLRPAKKQKIIPQNNPSDFLFYWNAYAIDVFFPWLMGEGELGLAFASSLSSVERMDDGQGKGSTAQYSSSFIWQSTSAATKKNDGRP